MKKFIITEEEKKQILKLYEENQTQGVSQFTEDMAKIFGVPTESVTFFESYNDNLDATTRQEYYKLAKDQMKEINFSLAKIARDGQFDYVISSLKSYNQPMNETQKQFLPSLVGLIERLKPQFEQFKTMPQDQWEQFFQSGGNLGNLKQPKTTNQETQSSDEKINTTNDRSFDYKLSGGKYYYSVKGQNKWIEATGKRLDAIKSRIKF